MPHAEHPARFKTGGVISRRAFLGAGVGVAAIGRLRPRAPPRPSAPSDAIRCPGRLAHLAADVRRRIAPAASAQSDRGRRSPNCSSCKANAPPPRRKRSRHGEPAQRFCHGRTWRST